MMDQLDKVLDKNEAVMEDFFETTLGDLDTFDAECWKKGDGYKIPRFPEIERRLEGVEAGLYLLAAESNVGKSAVMGNIIYDMATYKENNLFGIYYSLDDASGEIIPRIISMNKKIPISVSSKPQRYQNMIDAGEENASVYEDWLNLRQEGIQELKNNREMFKIVDSNTIRSVEQMYDHIKKVTRYLKTVDPDKKLVIGIDSINDLKFSEGKLAHGNETMSEVARVIKQWTVEFKCPIFGSTHLRKLNSNRRPTLDDLKDSVVIAFEASVVWLLFNDVSKNKQSAGIYYNVEGEDEKMPIIEMDWAKNKKSSFKGRTYNYFTQNFSLATECPQEIMKRYDALVYES